MRAYLWWISILILLLPTITFSQGIPRATGLILDDDAYNEVPHLPKFEGNKYTNLPLRVSLRLYCPTPGDQGYIGSCVGWACGYAGLTISRAVKAGITDQKIIDSMANSALYVYNQILKDSLDCNSGAKMTTALNFLKDRGDCRAVVFDDRVNNCSRKPEDSLHREASLYRVKDFAAVFSFLDEAPLKIDKTRKSLASRKPVQVGMFLTPSFWQIKPGQKTWRPEKGEEPVAAHAMIVIGYDEVSKEFELMNSWGPDFADSGFVWIPYETFGMYCKYGFQMILDDQGPVIPDVIEPKPNEELVLVPDTVIMEGKFHFRHPVGYQKDSIGGFILDQAGERKILFEEALVELDSIRGYYRLINKEWKVGDVFQLVTSDVPEGKYVYVFSFDPENKLEVHWPKENYQLLFPNEEQEVVAKMSRVPLANYIPDSEAEVVIPGVKDALQLTLPGKDHLCVLFADQPIEDFSQRILAFTNSREPFEVRFDKSFSDLLLPAHRVDYQEDAMVFRSISLSGEGSIVPIILIAETN